MSDEWYDFLEAADEAQRSSWSVRVEENLLKALKWAEKLGPQNNALTICLLRLAHFYQYDDRLADYSKSEQLYKRALEIKERNLGSDHPEVANALVSLGDLYLFMSNHSGGLSRFFSNPAGKREQVYMRALAIREKSLGPDSSELAEVCEKLAQFYKSQKQYDQAVSFYERHLDINEKRYGTHYFKRRELAKLYVSASNWRKAERLYQQTIEWLENKQSREYDDRQDLVWIFDDYIEMLQRLNRSDDAEAMEARRIRASRK